MAYEQVKTLERSIKSLKETFLDVPERMRLEQLVEMGDSLGDFPEQEKNPENLVKGCLSTVYLAAKVDQGRMLYSGYAETYIVKGYVALLFALLDGLSPREICNSKEEVEYFLEETGLQVSFTPSRKNVFFNLYEAMRQRACLHCEQLQASLTK